MVVLGRRFVLIVMPGIDMFIEYTHQNFDKKIVELGCAGLDFALEDRSQFYKAPLPSLG